jgi:spermidine synthase
MNEIGLDPGIDHLYAVKTIGEVHEKGGKVRFLKLFCPATDVFNNVLLFRSSSSYPTAVAFPPRNVVLTP